MDKIELKHKSWRDISINTYYDIVDILTDNDLAEYEKNIELLSILCECDSNDILNLNINEVRDLLSKCLWINDFEINPKVKFNNIKINNNKYKIDANFQNFTTAQYIDFQTFWSKKDLRKYYGNILACFIIPIDKKYANDYDVNDFANKLRDEIDILTANEILFFSQVELATSIRVLKICSDFMMKKAMKKFKKDPQKMEEMMKMKQQMDQAQIAILDGLLG